MSTASVYLVAALLAGLFALSTSDPDNGNAWRRNQLEGAHLIAFPRVGRYNIQKTWPTHNILERYGASVPKSPRSGSKKDAISENLWFGPRLGKRRFPSNGSAFRHIGDRLEDDYEGILKREIDGLIPFPRNGRSNAKSSKKNGASSGTGLWFGPRLGKRMDEVFYPLYLPEGMYKMNLEPPSPTGHQTTTEDLDAKA